MANVEWVLAEQFVRAGATEQQRAKFCKAISIEARKGRVKVSILAGQLFVHAVSMNQFLESRTLEIRRRRKVLTGAAALYAQRQAQNTEGQ